MFPSATPTLTQKVRRLLLFNVWVYAFPQTNVTYNPASPKDQDLQGVANHEGDVLPAEKCKLSVDMSGCHEYFEGYPLKCRRWARRFDAAYRSCFTWGCQLRLNLRQCIVDCWSQSDGGKSHPKGHPPHGWDRWACGRGTGQTPFLTKLFTWPFMKRWKSVRIVYRQ